MSPTLRTTMGLALAGLLCLAPLGMAAGPATEKSPGPSSAQVQPPSTNVPSVPARDRLMATVEGIDQSNGTLKLRAADGDRLEFKAPKGMLASLHEDSDILVNADSYWLCFTRLLLYRLACDDIPLSLPWGHYDTDDCDLISVL